MPTTQRLTAAIHGGRGGRATPVVEEVAPTPVVEEVAPTPVVEEVAPTPVVEEVAPTPVVEEVAPTPVVEEVALATVSRPMSASLDGSRSPPPSPLGCDACPDRAFCGDCRHWDPEAWPK
jgi:hypothetical protein